MSILFESNWLDFSSNPDLPIDVCHNLGECPKMIGLCGRDGDQENGFPMQNDNEGNIIPIPRLENTTDMNKVSVYKRAEYTLATQFKIKIFG